ncbi:proline and serine-rich protein 2 [Narcine bancroftii]|uniref:proline and serine-rich protein 2 n=1 Tax=Narcine bancroftii TaxID=1343680 RepID=UPI0038322813
MPVKLLYKEMDFDVSPSTDRRAIDSFANGNSSFSSRSRSSDSEEEFMNYLSREEQECILFFETTLDSLNDNFEDSSPNLSIVNEGLAPLSRINSENDEIIDLVETRYQPKELTPQYNNAFPDDEDRGRLQRDEWWIDPESPREKEPPRFPPTLHEPSLATHVSFEKTAPKSAVELGHAYPSLAKPPGSVPTPVVIAQKIAQRKVGHDFPQPTSPTEKFSSIEEKDRGNSTSPSDSRAFLYKNTKVQRFPANISISMPSREYNNTITKAAVKVQQRKAQVLANLGGSFLAAESDEKQLKGFLSSPRRTSSLKEFHQQTGEMSSNQESLQESLGEPISGLSKGLKPKVRNSGTSLSLNIPAEPSVHETSPIPPTVKVATHKPSPTETHPQAEPLTASVGVRRTHSFQKPTGFRPQGITVAFSGRGPTDESRKEALRKLGLLRINEEH